MLWWATKSDFQILVLLNECKKKSCWALHLQSILKTQTNFLKSCSIFQHYKSQTTQTLIESCKMSPLFVSGGHQLLVNRLLGRCIIQIWILKLFEKLFPFGWSLVPRTKGAFRVAPLPAFGALLLKYSFNCLKCFPFKGMTILFFIRFRDQQELQEGGN